MSTIELLRQQIGTIGEADIEAIIAGMSAEAIDTLAGLIMAEEEELKFNKFGNLFPDEGPLRRDLYPKHLEFFRVGKDYNERCFMAANRVGKTVAGGYETCCHLTGLYPPWWEGRRFRRPIRAWVAGDTNETTRDILQLELLGEVGYSGPRKIMDGSGIIPRDRILDPNWKTGVHNLVDNVHIKHVSGAHSLLGFKSYDQGRRVFQGTAKELIWLDEECPEDVYEECLMRTATTRGIILTTFTPLRGMSKVVLSFLPKEMRPAE
jgi:phage terminase large subunit-like protein